MLGRAKYVMNCLVPLSAQYAIDMSVRDISIILISVASYARRVHAMSAVIIYP